MFLLFSLSSLIACGDKTSETAMDSDIEDTAIDTGIEEQSTPAEIVLSDSLLTFSYLGESSIINTSILDQFGIEMDSVDILWDVSDTTIARVEEGLVTAVGNGQATLTVSVDTLQATVEITVSQVANDLTVTPTSVTFSAIGETQEMSAVVMDAGGTTIDSDVHWESNDLAVVTVDSAGLAHAQGNGTAEITASIDDITALVTVEVDATTFEMDSNGLTVLCPYAELGSTGELNGVTYTKRDRAGLELLIQARDWDAVQTTCTSGIQDMSLLFYNMYETIGDVTSWDVSSVNNTYRMFYNTGFFDQDIGHWDVSNVTNMGGMFSGVFLFNHDLSDWDVSNVTNFSSMFESAAAFNQDISGWDVSSATTMLSMFFDANGFNQDISSWDVSNVTNMSGMFCDAVDFNQDLSGWCVSNIAAEPNNFTCDYSSWGLPKPIWGTCPN